MRPLPVNPWNVLCIGAVSIRNRLVTPILPSPLRGTNLFAKTVAPNAKHIRLSRGNSLTELIVDNPHPLPESRSFTISFQIPSITCVPRSLKNGQNEHNTAHNTLQIARRVKPSVHTITTESTTKIANPITDNSHTLPPKARKHITSCRPTTTNFALGGGVVCCHVSDP